MQIPNPKRIHNVVDRLRDFENSLGLGYAPGNNLEFDINAILENPRYLSTHRQFSRFFLSNLNTNYHEGEMSYAGHIFVRQAQTTSCIVKAVRSNIISLRLFSGRRCYPQALNDSIGNDDSDEDSETDDEWPGDGPCEADLNSPSNAWIGLQSTRASRYTGEHPTMIGRGGKKGCKCQWRLRPGINCIHGATYTEVRKCVHIGICSQSSIIRCHML